MGAALLFECSQRKPRREHSLDSSPGLYALFLGPGAKLPGFPLPSEALIYIGKATGGGGLKARCHFNGGTRNHSPRKSLAAVLLDTLRLVPKPVLNLGSGTYKTWQLEPDSERALDRWMHENLLLSKVVASNAATIERPLIREYAPLLNLTDCAPTDAHRQISSMRAEIERRMRTMPAP